jgi:hypothetical protein
MDDNFLPSATFFGTSERSQVRHPKVFVPDVEPNLRVPLREMATWRTTNANLEDHRTQVVRSTSVIVIDDPTTPSS